MQTTIKNVEIEWVPGKGGQKWGKAKVTHDAGRGDKSQTIVSFKNPDVFKKVQELIGQTVEVENVKNGDFWEWKSITAASGASATGQTAPANTAATRVTGSNYETKEERAARQVLIVKQSALAQAVASLSVGAKTVPDTKTVLEKAQEYVDWVFATDTTSGNDNSFEDGLDVFN